MNVPLVLALIAVPGQIVGLLRERRKALTSTLTSYEFDILNLGETSDARSQ
ncbi:MAG: hypothetical protein Q8M31_22055 [Beijerinckiaceae bacterium]|nr:hypothetical protein [Beijerinckiaceae bacterium]